MSLQNNTKTINIQEVSEFILEISLNRPQVLNAINIDMMQDLLSIWAKLKENSQYRCILLTGQGRAFCAGADLKARLNMETDTWQSQHQVLQQAMRAMLQCPTPIIAVVNGAAFGGGLELALASDFIYAAKDAVFGQSEVKVGIMPGAMGTQNLPRACGLRRAKELTFTGERFSAQQAKEWGIVNEVFPAQKLFEAACEIANTISQNAPLAVKQAKHAINATTEFNLDQGYMFEIEVYNTLLQTEDRVEGINAFNEKRAPKFKGE